MRDLDFWRRLRAGLATLGELAQVASWPLVRRGPFLGRILPLASHRDPELRAAAMRVLTGCRGVAGVRAIVLGLDDDDVRVRDAALDALRATANHAPARFAHALFHPRPEIRRAALGPNIPRGAAAFAVYLRADPATAELAEQLLWPEGSLPLAFVLYETGRLAAAAFATIVVERQVTTLRSAIEQLAARDGSYVDEWLDHAVRGATPAPAGHDAFDTLVAALAKLESPLADWFVARLVELAAGIKGAPRRLATALVAHGVHSLGFAALFEPRLVASPSFSAAHGNELAALLLRFDWPVRPPVASVERLLALPIARDLRIGAALAGLLPHKRLATLAAALGDTYIASCLLAGDRGWDEICALPGETPPIELGWLAQIEAADYKRYIGLAGHAVARFTGKRLDAFVEQLAPRHRVPAFAAALRGASSDERAAYRVCRAVAARVDRGGLAALFATVLALPDPAAAKLLALGLVHACPAPLVADAVAWLAEPVAIALLGLFDRRRRSRRTTRRSRVRTSSRSPTRCRSARTR